MSSPATQFTVVRRTPNAVVGTAGPMLVSRMTGPAEEDIVQVMAQTVRGLVSRYDGRVGSLLLVRMGRSSRVDFDEASRRQASEVLRLGGKRSIAAVAIVEGEGFWAATVRAILSGITLLTRPEFPTKIFEHDEAALRFLTPLLPTEGPAKLSPEALREALAALRAS